MTGIVVVSHSAALAHAAVELALQMGGPHPPPLAVAAGTADGGLGTDAVAIAAAIDEVAAPDGVVVVMDLGSAILSAELALELVTTDVPVLLTPAPFVEGLVAAVVQAAAGADASAVAAEAGRAFEAKRAQLGGEASEPPPAPQPAGAADGVAEAFEAVVRNPSGLHARPAAAFARAAARYDARVQVADIDAGTAAVAGDSLLSLMSLGVHPGTRVRVSASGPQAQEALTELKALIDAGFGEL